jgi:hypothetical protein
MTSTRRFANRLASFLGRYISYLSSDKDVFIILTSVFGGGSFKGVSIVKVYSYARKPRHNSKYCSSFPHV